MSSESRRKSVLAIVEEVTEGTPVLPSSGSDYVALQQGFSMQAEPQTEESEEILGIVGDAAPIVKKSKSSAEISHYMRHSGAVTTEPVGVGKLIRGVLGTKVAAHSTDRTTTTGSTAGDADTNAVVKLSAGGSDFERGKAILCHVPRPAAVLLNAAQQRLQLLVAVLHRTIPLAWLLIRSDHDSRTHTLRRTALSLHLQLVTVKQIQHERQLQLTTELAKLNHILAVVAIKPCTIATVPKRHPVPARIHALDPTALTRTRRAPYIYDLGLAEITLSFSHTLVV